MAEISLREVLTYIEQHPNEHDQTEYGIAKQNKCPETACGTAMCFAGHAAVTFAGDTPRWKPFISSVDGSKYWIFDAVRLSDGQIMNVHSRAGDLLGLSSLEAEILFSSENTLDNLRKMVAMHEDTGHID